jgi:macrolide-specific efflux system membrane fusion protein
VQLGVKGNSTSEITSGVAVGDVLVLQTATTSTGGTGTGGNRGGAGFPGGGALTGGGLGR